MSLALKLLLRVIRRRIAAGETLGGILTDYPRLTEAERALIQAELGE